MGDYAAINGNSIKITDNQGREIFASLVDKKIFNLELSDWNGKGLYILNILDSQNKVVASKKLLIK